MAGHVLAARVKQLVSPIIEAAQLELVDIEFKHEGHANYLRIFIDKPGGVTLDDCQAISRECEVTLDIENIIHTQYILEVSSPGLDRPLKTKADFQRFQGKLAQITTYTPVQGCKKFLGYLEEVTEEPTSKACVISIRTRENGEFQIPYDMIASARLEVEF